MFILPVKPVKSEYLQDPPACCYTGSKEITGQEDLTWNFGLQH